MKNLRYPLFSLILSLLLGSCISPLTLQEPEADQDETVTVTFDVALPDVSHGTKAMGETPAIRYFKVAVFGSSGFLKQYATATFESASTNGATPTYTYNVNLTASNGKRIIHFIAYGKENEADTTDPIPMLPFAYENEIFSALTVSGVRDAYWQRIVLSDGIQFQTDEAGNPKLDESGNAIAAESTTQALSNVPLVRNFAKIKVTESADSFELISFAVVNKPREGAIAPYSTYDAFAEDHGLVMHYQDYPSTTALMNAHYAGNLPASVELDTTIPTDEAVREAGADWKFVYERPAPIANTNASQSRQTFFIVYGRYNGEPCYYKVNLMDGETALPIYRNFAYQINITKINRKGYATVAEAYNGQGSGDISSIASAENLTVSDGTAIMAVTQYGWTFTGAGTYSNVIGFRFEPKSNGVSSRDVTITQRSVTAAGAVLSGEVSNALMQASEASDGYTYLTLNVKEPGASTLEQVIRITGHYEGGGSIYREVKLSLMKMQEMTVTCSPSEVPSLLGEPVDVRVALQPKIPDTVFPLQFMIHSSALSLTPDGDNLPVTASNNTFYFNKTLLKSDYEALPLDSDGRPYFVAHFKTVKSASASTITVYNVNDSFEDRYFTRASDSFSNYVMQYFSGVSMSCDDYSDPSKQVAFRYTLGGELVPVTLTLSGMTPVAGSPLRDNGDGTWTYTPVSASQTLYFKPEDGNEGMCGITLGATHYETLSWRNRNLSDCVLTPNPPALGKDQSCRLSFRYESGYNYPLQFTLHGLETSDPRVSDRGIFTPDDENVDQQIEFKTTCLSGDVSIDISSEFFNPATASSTGRVKTFTLTNYGISSGLPSSEDTSEIHICYLSGGNFFNLGYFWPNNLRNVFIDLTVFEDLTDTVYFRTKDERYQATCTVGQLVNSGTTKLMLSFEAI